MPLQKERVKGKRPTLGQRMSAQGAPVDFPGQVLPNPNGIRPMADTDIPENTDAISDGKMTAGARMWNRNFQGKLKGTMENGRQFMPDIWKREQ